MIGERDVQHITTLLDDRPQDVQLAREPLHGGLEAAAVERVTARYRDRHGRARLERFVLKELVGPARREADVYERLVARHADGLAPTLFAVRHTRSDRAVLYLEAIRKAHRWPWRDVERSAALLQQLATFHQGAARAAMPAWNFEAELESSAVATLELLETLRRDPELSSVVRGGLRPATRLVLDLPKLRDELAGWKPLEAVPLHGDVHPGNAMVRRLRAADRSVLVDWGRARIGSPLEDVSSWLQSLGFWEPEAKRRHDTLLAGYISAWGLPRTLPSDLRSAYWLAGASNALAGALRYHLWVATDASTVAARSAAIVSARDWLRVIRRAAAVAT